MTISRAVRASKLMLAVMSALDNQPDKFKSVLDVFGEEQIYRKVFRQIMETYGKLILGIGLQSGVSEFTGLEQVNWTTRSGALEPSNVSLYLLSHAG